MGHEAAAVALARGETRGVDLDGVIPLGASDGLARALKYAAFGKAIVSSPTMCNPSMDALALTDDEKKRAKKYFEKYKDDTGEVNVGQFKVIIMKLIEWANSRKEQEGAKGEFKLPSEKDMEEAFTRADTDESGMVDWDEFLVPEMFVIV